MIDYALGRNGLDIYALCALGGRAGRAADPDARPGSLLAARLVDLSFAGLPLRTRAKAAKQQVCRALGYPVPPRLKRTQPRFPGQDCHAYVQKSAHLQLWNEDLARARRYVLVGSGCGPRGRRGAGRDRSALAALGYGR